MCGGELVSFQGRHSRAEAACVPLSAAGSAVVLQRGFGKSLPSEVNRERLPVPALTDTQCSHRHFPCSTLSEGPQMSLCPRSCKTGLNVELKLDYLIILRHVLWKWLLWWTCNITGNMLGFICWFNLWIDCFVLNIFDLNENRANIPNFIKLAFTSWHVEKHNEEDMAALHSLRNLQTIHTSILQLSVTEEVNLCNINFSYSLWKSHVGLVWTLVIISCPLPWTLVNPEWFLSKT